MHPDGDKTAQIKTALSEPDERLDESPKRRTRQTFAKDAKPFEVMDKIGYPSQSKSIRPTDEISLDTETSLRDDHRLANKEQNAGLLLQPHTPKVLPFVPKKTAAKYKKAPDAPKRFKSAFIFFSAEKQKQIRAQMPDKALLKTADIAKVVSQAWKELDPNEKERWEIMARRDKTRYEFEKSLYDGPWVVPNTRRPKDASAPKRPMSAFLAFANCRRSAVKGQMPGCSNGELSRALAAQWKDAPEDVRRRYIQEEYEKRKVYVAAMAEWRKKFQEGKRVERQEREEMAMHLAKITGANTEDRYDNKGSMSAESPYDCKDAIATENFAPTCNDSCWGKHSNHSPYDTRDAGGSGIHQSVTSCFYQDEPIDFPPSHVPTANPYEHSYQGAHYYPSVDSLSPSGPSHTFSSQYYFASTGGSYFSYPSGYQNDAYTSYPPASTQPHW